MFLRLLKEADACLPRPRSVNSAGPGPVGRGVFQQPANAFCLSR